MRSLEHQAWVEQQLIRIEKAIEQALPQGELTATRLFEALAYASLGGGKRIRALLVFGKRRVAGRQSRELFAGCCGLGNDSRLFACARRYALHGQRRASPW